MVSKYFYFTDGVHHKHKYTSKSSKECPVASCLGISVEKLEQQWQSWEWFNILQQTVVRENLQLVNMQCPLT